MTILTTKIDNIEYTLALSEAHASYTNWALQYAFGVALQRCTAGMKADGATAEELHTARIDRIAAFRMGTSNPTSRDGTKTVAKSMFEAWAKSKSRKLPRGKDNAEAYAALLAKWSDANRTMIDAEVARLAAIRAQQSTTSTAAIDIDF